MSNKANGLVLLNNNIAPTVISNTLTTVKKPVVYNIPAKVPASPAIGGIVRKCKKKLAPKTMNIKASK